MGLSVADQTWLNVIDDDVLEAVLRSDSDLTRPAHRPVRSLKAAEAVVLLANGQGDQAVAELEQAIAEIEARGTVPADLLTTLAQIRFDWGRFDGAADCFRRLAAAKSTEPDVHFNLGVCLGRAGNWTEARQAFEDALAAPPPVRPDAELALGICCLYCSEAEPARIHIDRYLESHPQHRTAQFARAVCLQRLGRPEEATAIYQELLDQQPDSPDCLVNLIALTMTRGDHALLEDCANRLLALRSDSRPAREGLLAAAVVRQDWPEVALRAAELLKVDPGSFEAWFNRGVALQQEHDSAGAVDAYSHAAQIRPQEASTFVNLAIVREEMGDAAGARHAYERALDILPESPGALWNLALLALHQSEAHTAEDLLEQVVLEWSDMSQAWFQLGWVRLERKRWPEAAQAFETCLANQPEWSEALLNAGIAYWRAGDGYKARESLRKAAALGGVLGAEAAHCLCLLSIEAEDAEEARRWRERAGPQSTPELEYNTALLLQKNGRAREALPLYREALNHKPETVEALINLGLALHELGQDTEARECWDRARAVAPEASATFFPRAT